MRNVRRLSFVGCASFFSKNIAYLCGCVVQKFVQKKRITTRVFTHYTQQFFIPFYLHTSHLILHPTYTHSLHNIFVQKLSVNGVFYTLYTGPITTTTYNIFKKGL
jgi:hypothetical protein